MKNDFNLILNWYFFKFNIKYLIFYIKNLNYYAWGLQIIKII